MPTVFGRTLADYLRFVWKESGNHVRPDDPDISTTARMKRAALYARVSTDRQKEDQTIDSQLFELKKQIARSGNVLVKEYIEDGHTGTEIDRPALDELRRDAKGDIFDAIYFYSADRIARDVAHQTIIVDELRKRGKTIVIGGKDYEHNPENKLTLTMLGAFAEFERAKIIERMTRGWRHRVRSGAIVSQGHCTFGLDYVKKTETSPAAIVINAQEAGIVRWIFEAYASGMALSAITRTLEERKVPTKKGKTLWRAQGVRYLLANRTYVGTRYYNTMTLCEDISGKGSGKRKSYTYRDRSEWIGVPVPAIIPQELFDCVQARMQESKEKYRHPITHYLLSGLVECGVCGAGFSSYRRYVKKHLTIGKRRVYHKSAYKCNIRTAAGYHARANMERCRNKEVATHLLEDAVFDIVQKQMLDPSTLRACMDALKSNEQKDHAKIGDALMRLARDIQAADERKKKLVDLYASGNMTEELYVNANIALDKELYALKQKKEEFTRGLPPLHEESIDVSVRQFC